MTKTFSKDSGHFGHPAGQKQPVIHSRHNECDTEEQYRCLIEVLLSTLLSDLAHINPETDLAKFICLIGSEDELPEFASKAGLSHLIWVELFAMRMYTSHSDATVLVPAAGQNTISEFRNAMEIMDLSYHMKTDIKMANAA